jgi:hypothetical protein
MTMNTLHEFLPHARPQRREVSALSFRVRSDAALRGCSRALVWSFPIWSAMEQGDA